MAAASTHLTAKIGENVYAPNVTTAVTTRALNLSEPDNTDDIEVIFLESTVLTKGQAVELLERMKINILSGDWPR